MRSDNRMLRLNGLPTSNTPSVDTAVDLLNTRVYSTQPMQSLLELRRQAVVCLCHVAKKGVTAGRRPVQDIQESSAGRLLLKCHVRVPGDRVRTGRQELSSRFVFGSTVHQVDFRETLGGSRGLVDVVTAEVASEFDGLGDGEMRKVLVTEGWKTKSVSLRHNLYRGLLVVLITYQRPFSVPHIGPAGPCPLCSVGLAARL